MSIETKVTEVLQKVLDVEASEIKGDASLATAFGVDSTEMVEISVGIKKSLGVPIGDNELKKTHSFDQIVEILKGKGAQ
ncbi:MAG: acyl carrier protein [Candidatus Omnitrophica bacterium]|nr:acyl carrier protein [Candidatus Omnitrophota bacterium]